MSGSCGAGTYVVGRILKVFLLHSKEALIQLMLKYFCYLSWSAVRWMERVFPFYEWLGIAEGGPARIPATD